MILAVLPALPLHTAGKYVAAAYIVLLLLILAYCASLAARVGAMERDVNELLADSEEEAVL